MQNNIFARGVYVGENTSQTANVRIVRMAGDECAAAGCETSQKMQGIFCDNKKPPLQTAAGFCVAKLRRDKFYRRRTPFLGFPRTPFLPVESDHFSYLSLR